MLNYTLNYYEDNVIKDFLLKLENNLLNQFFKTAFEVIFV